MQTVENGQCGVCAHFGEHVEQQTLVQIRTSHEAPEGLVDECGKPELAQFQLKVTPISGCQGFEPAAA